MILYNKKDIPDHLQKYFEPAELGLEKTPDEYVSKLVDIFREVKRVLRDDGTLWLNLGDSYCGSWGNSGHRPELDKTPSVQREKNCEYIKRGGWDNRRETPPNVKVNGLKPKDLVGIPWMVAFALRADGWYLRQDIIWAKKNCMPESVTDRCTKSHEYIFLLSKSARYFYDAEAIREKTKRNWANVGGNLVGKGVHKQGGNYKDIGDRTGGGEKYGRNKRSVWTVATKPFSKAHFATFPAALIEPCILSGCPKGGTVLDPFFGSGTTGVVAYKHDRRFVGIELSKVYLDDIVVPRIEAETRQLKLF